MALYTSSLVGAATAVTPLLPPAAALAPASSSSSSSSSSSVICVVILVLFLVRQFQMCERYRSSRVECGINTSTTLHLSGTHSLRNNKQTQHKTHKRTLNRPTAYSQTQKKLLFALLTHSFTRSLTCRCCCVLPQEEFECCCHHTRTLVEHCRGCWIWRENVLEEKRKEAFWRE